MHSIKTLVEETKNSDKAKFVTLGHRLIDQGKDIDMDDLKEFISVIPRGRAPSGMKKERKDLDYLLKSMDNLEDFGVAIIPSIQQNVSALLSWKSKEDIIKIADAFFKGKPKVNEIKVGNMTFKNESAMGEARFKKVVSTIGKVLKGMKGNYKKALKGNLNIIIKSPDVTKAKATYKEREDEIWIKNAPASFKGMGTGKYATLDMIIVHELFHRLAKLEYNAAAPKWFTSKPESYWWTTDYSKTTTAFDGYSEPWAELGALAFFGKGMHPKYDQWEDKIEEFKGNFE